MNNEIVNVSLQILPIGEEEISLERIDRVLEYIGSTGVKYLVGPMETTMEGPYHQLMDIVAKAQDICFKEGAGRVVSVIKVDAKKTGVTMDEKIKKYR
ncbi:thiamine-binding protein [Alkalibacter rhizosphaerae]|uniref:Thiamine-binding protein n=1 Tax=Alkalibacter rhizosphaerae TaxID=2815577 RepID=A0A974XHM5_9FIRM|nr:thiamine-binding protein [Alkalibacter rhizosphaerae]QSX08840.1 thiamine-binding protein [Alkalibacter rhizosphaerae]